MGGDWDLDCQTAKRVGDGGERCGPIGLGDEAWAQDRDCEELINVRGVAIRKFDVHGYRQTRDDCGIRKVYKIERHRVTPCCCRCLYSHLRFIRCVVLDPAPGVRSLCVCVHRKGVNRLRVRLKARELHGSQSRPGLRVDFGSASSTVVVGLCFDGNESVAHFTSNVVCELDFQGGRGSVPVAVHCDRPGVCESA